MKPNPEQQHMIDRLSAKHREFKLAELTVRERVQQQVERELNVLLVERSQAANDALAAGVSKTRIGKAMNTSDWSTVRSVLDLAGPTEADLVAAEAKYLKGDGWSFDTETLTFELTAWRHRHTKKIEKRTLTVPMHKVEVMDGYGKRSTILRAVNNKADLYDLGVDDQDWFRPVVVAEVEALIGLRDPEPEQAPGPLPITTDYGYGDPSTWGTAEDEDDDE